MLVVPMAEVSKTFNVFATKPSLMRMIQISAQARMEKKDEATAGLLEYFRLISPLLLFKVAKGIVTILPVSHFFCFVWNSFLPMESDFNSKLNEKTV